jgi:hypothetical protein
VVHTGHLAARASVTPYPGRVRVTGGTGSTVDRAVGRGVIRVRMDTSTENRHFITNLYYTIPSTGETLLASQVGLAQTAQHKIMYLCIQIY